MNPLMLLQLLAPLLTRAERGPSSADDKPAASTIDPAVFSALIAAAVQRPPTADPSPPVRMPWAAGFISATITLGFFALMGAISWLLIIGQQPNAALLVGFGALLSWVTVIVAFYLGSSFGSRQKDVRPSAEPVGSPILLPPIVPPTLPSEPPVEPVESGIGRSTSPDTAEKRSDLLVSSVPASIRYNNPGAQYPSGRAAAFGQIGYGVIGGGHKIALFPHSVNGAAANFDLLYRNYTGMTIGAAGDKWTGGAGFGVPGYDPNAILAKESLDKPEVAIALMKAVARREAGRESPLTDEQWRQAYDMFRSGSADAWLDRGSVSSKPGKPLDLAASIVAAMIKKGYTLDTKPGQVNIVYVEGMNEDGTINNDAPDGWNDLRVVIGFDGEKPVILGKWTATTEPGKYYTDNPVNPSGAARIAFGQYTAWRVGMHRGVQEALVQRGPVTVCRDLNKDMVRTGDARDTGDSFGINQHHGYNQSEDSVGKTSAGCLVGRTEAGHKAFLSIVKSDPRFIADPDYLFRTAILAERDVAPV